LFFLVVAERKLWVFLRFIDSSLNQSKKGSFCKLGFVFESMGKKKMPKKTKELSVAIAESSSIAEDTQQQQQIVTPRKRGRPRKIVEKTESEEIKEIKKGEEEEEDSESKKAKMIGEEEEEEKKLMKVEGATSSSVAKEIQPQRKSRARRKSKPRKSS